MSELDRGYGVADPYRRSASGHSPSTSRSYRMAVDQHHREGIEVEAPAKRDSSRRRHENNTQEDYLSPLIPSSRRGRGRVDSLSSIGSSVAPAALPKYQSRNHTSSRHQHRDGMSPSTSTATGSGGGLEAWLQSQAVAGGNVNGQEIFPSFAPSGRLRKMNAVDEAEIGSDAGRSIGAKSAGPRVNGNGSGRNNRERQKRSVIPEWDPNTFDGDAAGLAGFNNPDAQKLENVLRWRKDSTTKSITKERNDMSDLDHIAPESRRRRREVAGSFSASGLSILREGVRRPRKLHAEPSLDALLSSSMNEQNNGNRIPSSRSFGGNSVIAGGMNNAREATITTKEKERLEDQGVSSPLRSFVRWFLLEGAKSTAPGGEGRPAEGGMMLMSVTAILISILFKWIVGLGNWSGRGISPLHGDFEAQRHWMEITLHLPRNQWYYYDTKYWGLDYPPLTAIVSMWCAKVASLIPGLSPSFALDTSRGDESPILVVFMRATVLVLDLIIYTPAIFFFLSRKLQGRGRRTRSIAILSVLLQPAVILVDNGHFQYNTVMLGLSAIAFSLLYTSLPNPDLSLNSTSKMTEEVQKRITSLSRKISYEYIAAAVFFSLSLGFKQMALYYAPAVFAIMLGRCWGLARIGFERGLICFLGIAMATILTFAGMFRSWLTDLSQLAQIIHRIFPISRGLFEDKVSNVWCFLTVLPIPARYKLRNLMSSPALAKVSLATTLAVILLPCVHLFAAAVETVRIEMFLDQDIRRQMMASEKRIIEGSVAGSSRARNRKASQVAPSEAGSDLASILSGARGGGGASTIRGGTEARGLGPILERKAAIVASSSPSPAASLLPYALLSTSLAFFLFGFQTHEKSILLPLLPITLLMSTKGDEWGGGAGKTDWEWAVLTNNIAVFSMWPLLQRDGIPLQYFTMSIFWNWCIGYQPFAGLRSHRQSFVAWFGATVHLAMISLHLLEFVSPFFSNYLNPILARYPDLFPVLNVLLCTPCLCLVWLWSIKRQVEVGFASGIDILSLQGKGTSKSRSKSKKEVVSKTNAM